ncbi:hypothetical protein AB2S23_28365, partial [Klebsiella pneumoniae]|uniref:hypothetical protein n=1 Tax=Klebsiella pneumoniae TaxID=573 RepID=UPI003462D1A2
ALLGVELLEPYLLPPALAATLIGAVAVARDRAGRLFYAIGLASSVVPSLVLLAVSRGAAELETWRTVLLLAASLLLIGIGLLLRRTRLAALVVPTLLVSVLAAAAGAVLAVRVGVGATGMQLPPGSDAILVALGLS